MATMPWTVRQPWRGIVGFCVTTALAWGLAFAFDVNIILTTVTAWAVAFVAPEVITCLVWGGRYPAEKMDQPWRGIALTALTFFIGLAALTWGMRIAGGEFLSGGAIFHPVILIWLIMTVIIALWLVLGFGCWPFAGRMSVGVLGFVMLIATYVLDVILFRLASFQSLAVDPTWAGIYPSHIAKVDPGGPFAYDSFVSFSIMTVMGLFLLVTLDFWPLTKFKSLMKQPWMGITCFIFAFAVAIAIYEITVTAMGMTPIEAMTKVAICWLLGVFIILPMFQTWPGRLWKQPLGGMVNWVFAAAIAVVAFYLYRWVGFLATHNQDLVAALPGVQDLQTLYGLGIVDPTMLWLATVMLGFQFPLMFMYGSMFDFWPLPPTPPPPGAPQSE